MHRVNRQKGNTVAIIESVGAREILDSRGNPTVEVEVALDAFSRGRVLLLVDDRQVTELADEVVLAPGSAVTFLRLTPLVGG